MSEQDEPKEQSGQQPSAMMTSITMAFNMGVSALQQAGPRASVVELAGQMAEAIYSNLSRAYGGQHMDDHLRANSDFFLQIALLGYIIPNICAYDEEFKTRLFELIEAKVSQQRAQAGAAQKGSSIITD